MPIMFSIAKAEVSFGSGIRSAVPLPDLRGFAIKISIIC